VEAGPPRYRAWVTSPATPPEPEEPKLLRGGRYALLRKLGEGSQGQTYEAMDHGVGPDARRRAARAAPLADKWSRYVREQKSGGEVPQDAKLVAIKCFRVGSAKAWKDVELAEREARTLSALDHPRLPRYFEHFEEEGALYLVMEKIEGESLATIRKNGRAMSAADVTRMLEDIADALRYLHGRAPLVVHRDIKPGNILRRPDGSFALVDFGAVRDRLKPAGGSTVVGTFGFMAPEQFQGRAAPGSDVYGLGATAITMLTGIDPEELPHEGLGIDVTRALPKGTPAPLARALAAMLVPDPDRRVGSIDEALAILHDRSRAPLPTKKRRAKKERPPKKDRKQRRAMARGRRAPLLPRFLGRLGLLVALVLVWAIVGFAAPTVLVLLSLLFGGSLRRAAARCVRAARRSQAALGRASMWLSGHRVVPDGDAEPSVAKVRVAAAPMPTRMAGDDEAAAEAVAEPVGDADAWMEQRLEREAQRERMRMHAKAPPKRRFWGR
jgi:serine/threonine protein kinase